MGEIEKEKKKRLIQAHVAMEAQYLEDKMMEIIEDKLKGYNCQTHVAQTMILEAVWHVFTRFMKVYVPKNNEKIRLLDAVSWMVRCQKERIKGTLL